MGTLDDDREGRGGTKPGRIRLAMQRTMQRHCAVYRDGPMLEEGLRKLGEVIEMMHVDVSITDRSMIFNTDLGEMLELDNMLAQAVVSYPSFLMSIARDRGGRTRLDMNSRHGAVWSCKAQVEFNGALR